MYLERYLAGLTILPFVFAFRFTSRTSIPSSQMEAKCPSTWSLWKLGTLLISEDHLENWLTWDEVQYLDCQIVGTNRLSSEQWLFVYQVPHWHPFLLFGRKNFNQREYQDSRRDPGCEAYRADRWWHRWLGLHFLILVILCSKKVQAIFDNEKMSYCSKLDIKAPTEFDLDSVMGNLITVPWHGQGKPHRQLHLWDKWVLSESKHLDARWVPPHVDTELNRCLLWAERHRRWAGASSEVAGPLVPSLINIIILASWIWGCLVFMRWNSVAGITPMLQIMSAVFKDKGDSTTVSLLFANQVSVQNY